MSSRHPSTFLPVCLIEATERFAGGLLGAVLIFHLAENYQFRPGRAAQLQALFLGLTYGLSILGGLIVDRALGYRRALTVGLLLLGTGYTILSLGGHFALFGGLSLLVLGQAFFKPTVSAVVGSLYQRQPELRTAGFAWFYVAINIAAAIAPWIASPLRHWAGWSGTMVAAAWSVALGLGVLLYVVAKLPEPATAPTDTETAAGEGLTTSGAARARWLELGLILITVLSFTVAYSQSEGTLLFFARDRLVRSIKGFELPAEAFAALPAMLVLILKPVLDVVLRSTARRGRRFSGKTLLTLGLLLTSGAFVLLAGITLVSPLAKLSPAWFLSTEVLLTIAELLVMPGAMALVAELFPAKHGALSQGTLFGVQALGFFCSGLVGSWWGKVPDARFFGVVAVLPLVALVVHFVARYWLRRVQK